MWFNFFAVVKYQNKDATGRVCLPAYTVALWHEEVTISAGRTGLLFHKPGLLHFNPDDLFERTESQKERVAFNVKPIHISYPGLVLVLMSVV